MYGTLQDEINLNISQTTLLVPVELESKILEIQDFRENFIFVNIVKSLICDIKSMRLCHDLPLPTSAID